jgi:hypothetical protein
VSETAKPVELTVVDTNTAAWELFPVAYIGANLEHVPLMSDPDTGMITNKPFDIHFVGDENDPAAPKV